MDLTAVTLTELRYLVAVADLGHFGRAADACHVTQPTLSTQIRKLEDTLGVPLFERRPKRVQPTAAGREVIERARVVLAELRAIGEVARGHADPLAGPLRVGIIPTLGPYVLPRLVPKAQEVFPNLQLAVHEVVTPQLLADLERGHLDAALLALPVRHPGLVSEPLFDEPFWLLVPAGHPLATRPRITERDLDRQHVLLLTEGHCLRDQALALCGRPAGPARDDFRATSLETLRHLVAAGLGVTLVPALALPTLATLPAVVVRPFRDPAPGRRIGLVWRRNDPRAEGLRRFGAFVRSRLPAGVHPVRDGAAPMVGVVDPTAPPRARRVARR